MKAESGLIWDGNEDISNSELGWQSESGPYFWRTLPFRLWQAFFGGNHTHAWNGSCRCTYIGIDDSSTMVASSHLRQQQKKHALMIEPAQHVNQTTVHPVFWLLLFHHKTGHQLHHYEYTVWLFSIVHMVCLQILHMLQPWFCGPWASHFQPPGLSVTQLPSKPWAHVTVQISPLIT